jgi:predicted CXXCH cytochrome family protein
VGAFAAVRRACRKFQSEAAGDIVMKASVAGGGGRRLAPWLLAALACVQLGAVGQASAGTIVGSKHDLRNFGFADEICVVCHTPHNADVAMGAVPLWSHTTTTRQFEMYTSPTMDAISTGQPSAGSLLCLSCHDGTVAIDSYGGRVGSITLGGGLAVGAGPENLSDDHPISIVYDQTLSQVDPGLFDPSSRTVTIGVSPSKTGTIAELLVVDDQVQCSSCHDVHNTYTAGEPLLKVSNQGSALCLSCHNR